MDACVNHPLVNTGLAPCDRCGRTFCSNCRVELGGKSLCGGCKAEQVLDVRSGTTALDLAGPGARFLAQVVDQFVILIPGIAVAVGIYLAGSAAGLSADANLGVVTLATTVLILGGMFFYEALMLRASGQTLGKSVAKIKVVTREGGELTPRHAWIRSAARAGCQITRILGPIDALMVYSGERRTLHDRAAGTVVVRWNK